MSDSKPVLAKRLFMDESHALCVGIAKDMPGWKQTGALQFTDSDGATVDVCEAALHRLRSRDIDVLYIGPLFHDTMQSFLIMSMCKERGIKIVSID